MYASRRTIVAFWLIAASVGCFRTTAPSDFLPSAQQATQDAFGGWVRADLPDDIRKEGELLAVTPDTMFLLTTSSGWMALPMSQVRMATLTGYKVSLEPIVTWGVLGSLSTISHGFILILTAPIWILTSSTVGASVSRAPRIRSVDPTALAPFARFPQGLAPDLDRSAIRSRYSLSP